MKLPAARVFHAPPLRSFQGLLPHWKGIVSSPFGLTRHPCKMNIQTFHPTWRGDQVETIDGQIMTIYMFFSSWKVHRRTLIWATLKNSGDPNDRAIYDPANCGHYLDPAEVGLRPWQILIPHWLISVIWHTLRKNIVFERIYFEYTLMCFSFVQLAQRYTLRSSNLALDVPLDTNWHLNLSNRRVLPARVAAEPNPFHFRSAMFLVKLWVSSINDYTSLWPTFILLELYPKTQR